MSPAALIVFAMSAAELSIPWARLVARINR
jgi:hypothetical protein